MEVAGRKKCAAAPGLLATHAVRIEACGEPERGCLARRSKGGTCCSSRVARSTVRPEACGDAEGLFSMENARRNVLQLLGHLWRSQGTCGAQVWGIMMFGASL